MLASGWSLVRCLDVQHCWRKGRGPWLAREGRPIVTTAFRHYRRHIVTTSNIQQQEPSLAAAVLAVCSIVWALPVLASPGVVAEYVFAASSLPRGVAVDPDTRTVYIADAAAGEVKVFDTDLQPAGRIATDPGPSRIAIDRRHATKRLFVANATAGNVQVISLPAGGILCTLPTGPIPHVAFNPASEKLYVAVEGANRLMVYGGKDSCDPVAEISLGSKPVAVAVDAAANRVYVPIQQEQVVAVIDGASDSLLDRIAVLPGEPTDVAASPETHKVTVAYNLGNAVTEIDTGPAGSGPYRQRHLVVGDGPRYVQVDPAIDRTYVSNVDYRQLGVIDAGVVAPKISLSMVPAFTGVDTEWHCAYTTGDLDTLRKVVKICDDALPDAWSHAYDILFASRDEVAAFRAFRDRLIASDATGKLYLEMLYENGQDALDVLVENPDLLAEAKRLIAANEEAIAIAAGGQQATLRNTDEFAEFLKDFAEKSPSDLKFWLRIVRGHLLRSQKQAEPFLAFALE